MKPATRSGGGERKFNYFRQPRQICFCSLQRLKSTGNAVCRRGIIAARQADNKPPRTPLAGRASFSPQLEIGTPCDIEPTTPLAIEKHEFLRVEYCEVLEVLGGGANWNNKLPVLQRTSNVMSGWWVAAGNGEAHALLHCHDSK